jgi:hypothetical protein
VSRLAERYRFVLRLLPADYRQEWEEDMVAAFLDSMDTGDPETTAYLATTAGRACRRSPASCPSPFGCVSAGPTRHPARTPGDRPCDWRP